MVRRRIPDPVPLWRNHQPLTGINRPRIASMPIAGLPEEFNGRNEVDVILATEEVLHAGACRNAVLASIAKRCCFLSDAWSYQRPFFSNLMASYFSQASDLPAWISIYPRRVTFRSRQDQGRRVRQTSGLFYSQFPATKLRDNALCLGGYKISGEDLLLTPKTDRRLQETHVVIQTIDRAISDRTCNIAFRIQETWSYLATPGDADDVASALSGSVPALGRHFDKKIGVQNAAIVSLCRLSECGKFLDVLAFNLEPFEGKVLDFRSSLNPFAYTLMSDANNHALLTQVVTPGGWQHL